MDIIKLDAQDMKNAAKTLRAGDRVSLTGYIYTARDAAHLRFSNLLDKGEPLPLDIDGATIYYTGPTPAKNGMPAGSCGPTTSGRMDGFAPRLMDLGMSCMIGKGERDQRVIDAIVRNGAAYLAAVGGAGAYMARCVKSLEVIAFDDLGTESVKRLYVEDFPATVAIDCVGGNLYVRG